MTSPSNICNLLFLSFSITVATTNTNRFNDREERPSNRSFLYLWFVFSFVRRHLSSIVVLFFQAPRLFAM